MSDAELQEEEREVLLSIYDGDAAFKQLSPTTYQYKVGPAYDLHSSNSPLSLSEPRSGDRIFLPSPRCHAFHAVSEDMPFR